jgi:integrase
MLKSYNYYCTINQIEWKRPKYRYERKIPLIPTTDNINKIIAASSKKYATIFRILAETGIEGRELTTTRRKDIDAEQGIINVQGCKMHASRSIKLTPTTADLLRQYLHTYTDDYPFPDSHWMSEIWIRTRNELAKKLNEPQLHEIPMRNLRHYNATRTYAKTKDILYTQHHLGHKKLETTMLYVQLISFEEDEEYTVRTATNVKEATDLLEHGFTYIQDIDGIKIYRKRK